MITIELPWPPKELNPNHKCHWGKKFRASKKYREDCTLLANIHYPRASKLFHGGGDISLDLTFIPPDRRKRDDDNCEGAFKSGRDAIAWSWKINDNRFRVTKRIAEETVKGGKVIVKIEPLERGL